MGTVVGLPAGPDLPSQCNQCLTCISRSFGQGKEIWSLFLEYVCCLYTSTFKINGLDCFATHSQLDFKNS